MLKKIFLVVLILLGASYAGAEFAAASFAEKAIAESAAERDPLAREVTAQVSKPLLFNLLRSSVIDRIEVSTTHVQVGPVSADRATAVLYGVRLDVGASIAQREPVVESIDRLEMTLEISQGAASAVLPEGFRFEFHSGGRVVLAGNGIEVSGRLTLVPPATLRFEPDAGSVPPGINPEWTLEEIPFVTCLESLEISEGVARVSCSQEDPPPDFPPR